jgi:hypothetical protein
MITESKVDTEGAKSQLAVLPATPLVGTYKERPLCARKNTWHQRVLSAHKYKIEKTMIKSDGLLQHAVR